MFKNITISLLVLQLLCTYSVQADTLIDQNPMTEMKWDRLMQNLPGRAAWFSSGSIYTVEESNGALNVRAGTSLIAHFTKTEPLELAIGDTLKLSVVFETEMLVTQSGSPLRFAILNSGGKRVVDDQRGSNNDMYLNYSGYAAFLRHGDTRAMVLRKRDAGKTNILINSERAYSSLVNPTASFNTGGTIINDLPYELIMTLTRKSESEISVSASVSGTGLDNYSHTTVDSGSPESAFDTIVIWSSETHTNGIAIKNVSLEHIVNNSANTN
jgi:hypothetical protein